MGLLEDELRGAFAAKVASAPTVDAPADRAIQAAMRIRRRRSVGVTTSAVVGVLVITLSIGMVATSTAPRFVGGAQKSVPLPVALDVSPYVLSGGEITGPGTQVSVRGQMAARAWRLADAFLVETRAVVTSGVLLWYVPANGGARRLLISADQLAIAPAMQVGLAADQGPVVAWRDGRTVSWGRLHGEDLVTMRSSQVSADLAVAGLVSGGVLLTTGDTYDLWFPGAGAFVPGPTVASRLLVPAADGSVLYGVVNGNGCLARLSLHGLEVVDRTCAVAVGSHDGLYPSPDGQWLVATSAATVRLFELPNVFDRPAAAGSWSLRASDVSWLGDGTFAVLTDTGVVRLHTDEVPRTPVPVPVEPDGPDSARTLVADLTAGAR